MKIGFDAKRVFNNASGLGNYSRNIVNALLKYYPENEYFLFTPHNKKQLYQLSYGQTMVMPNGVWKKLSSLWRSVRIPDHINRLNLDIYHGLSHELPNQIGTTKARSIVTIHDLIFLRYPEFYKFPDRVIYYSKFSKACRNADKIIAISEQTKQDIVDFFNIQPQKIEVIYQPINERFFTQVSEEEKQKATAQHNLPKDFMLYVGTIEERKNLLSVVKALSILKTDYPLVVIGRQTPYIEKVKAFIQKENMQNIIFLNSISNDDLHSIYTMAKIVLYPSVFEGFGLPVAEAQACGTPVITSNVSSLPEAGGDAALLVEPTSAEQIAEAIQKLLNYDEFYQQKVQQSLKNAERFTPEQSVKSLMNLYLS